jgi:hypothetical protein
VAGFDRSFVVAAGLAVAAALVALLTISRHVGREVQQSQLDAEPAIEGAA